MRFEMRFLFVAIALGGMWCLPAAAHPSLGESFSFDLEKKFKISVQFDQRNPKTGHLDFSQDEDTGDWSVQATPSKYHGPDLVNSAGLFVDRREPLSNPILKALRKGWLPLLRGVGPGEDGDEHAYVFEFATPVQISQMMNGSWDDDSWDDDDDEDRDGDERRDDDDSLDSDSPILSFYSDIAGTNLVTPTTYYQNSNQDQGAKSLVAAGVRRIVVASHRLTSNSQQTGGATGAGGTDIPEPATTLLLLPGLLLITVARRRIKLRNAAN